MGTSAEQAPVPVTGGSGYLAGFVIIQILEAGPMTFAPPWSAMRGRSV